MARGWVEGLTGGRLLSRHTDLRRSLSRGYSWARLSSGHVGRKAGWGLAGGRVRGHALAGLATTKMHHAAKRVR